jgi:hypothetical protein
MIIIDENKDTCRLYLSILSKIKVIVDFIGLINILKKTSKNAIK